MAFYHEFIVNRPEPDRTSLLNTLRVSDATAGLNHFTGTNKYIIKKATAWTTPQINGTLTIINNAPNATPQLHGQADVDNFSIMLRALVLTLIDEINILRSNAGLTPRTPQQAITAIRNKAGTL